MWMTLIIGGKPFRSERCSCTNQRKLRTTSATRPTGELLTGSRRYRSSHRRFPAIDLRGRTWSGLQIFRELTAQALHNIPVGRRSKAMLYTIAVILLIMWLLGLVSGYTIGAFIHVLLVVAIVLFLVGLITGRRVA
jgi:hypothetical protein